MKTILASAILSFGLAASATVHAGQLRVGAQLLVSPDGTLTYDVPGEEVVTDSLAPSYGVAALVGYDVSRYLTVGLAPSALFGARRDRLDDDPDTGTELDLALRFTGRLPISSSGIELQLHATPGYSWVLAPSERMENPSGLVVGLGLGLAVPVSSRLSIVGELGKTYGWHRTMARGYFPPGGAETVRDIEYSPETLRVGLGVQATL